MPDTPATLQSASKRRGSVWTISATPWAEPMSALTKASSGRPGGLTSTPTMSAPSATASSPMRAPIPEEIPVMTIVLPNSMSAPLASFRRLLGARAADVLGQAKAVSDRKQPQRRRVLDPAPEAAREKQRENECRRPESDQIPDAHVAEPGFDGEEYDGAENRPLEGPQAAHQGHEDHVGRP